MQIRHGLDIGIEDVSMAESQYIGCQLEAIHYYCWSMKKIMSLFMQNHNFDPDSILEKTVISISIIKIVRPTALVQSV